MQNNKIKIKSSRKSIRSIKSRKAQIKMGETIAILFVFFFILVIAAIFYVRIQAASTQREVTESFELRAVSLSQLISFLPETQCSESNVVKSSCFDYFKIQALANLSTDEETQIFYSRELGISKIEVKQIYPPGGNFTIYDNEPEFFIEAPISRFPISLYDAPNEKYYFGVLEITVYKAAEAPQPVEV